MIKKIYEMPYISYKADKTFDLELEKFSNTKDLLFYIKEILSGKELKDKYGNDIKLVTDKEKDDFINHLKSNKIFINVVDSKLSAEEKIELEKLLV